MLVAATMLPGCSADDAGNYGDDTGDEVMSLDEALELGTLQQGVMSCSNPEGANAAMAAREARSAALASPAADSPS